MRNRSVLSIDVFFRLGAKLRPNLRQRADAKRNAGASGPQGGWAALALALALAVQVVSPSSARAQATDTAPPSAPEEPAPTPLPGSGPVTITPGLGAPELGQPELGTESLPRGGDAQTLGGPLVSVPEGPFYSSDPVLKGREIAENADQNNGGWENSIAELKMILTNNRGRESRREMEIRIIEGTGEEGDKSLVIFADPADIAGTALLSFNNVSRANDQWLFLPSLRKTRRIASSKRNGSFVGSQFTYDDMMPSDVDEFTYVWQRDEPCDLGLCHVVERVPTDENAGYSRQLIYWDTEEFRAVRIDYFDKRNELDKKLQNSDFQLHNDEFWRPHRQLMVNDRSQEKTELILESIAFKTAIRTQDFNPQRLDKIR